MNVLSYPSMIHGLKQLHGFDVCFTERIPEDHHVAGKDEAFRYINGTCYESNSDYILFAREIHKLFNLTGKRVAEFCTGPGMLSLELAKYSPELVYGIDGSWHMIQNARSLTDNSGKVRFICSNLLDLNGNPSNLDMVVCQNSLHHFDSGFLSLFIQSALRSLKPGGYLYLSDYKRESLNPGVLAKRLEETNEHVREDLINTFKAAFTRYELAWIFTEFTDQMDFDVFFPDDIFCQLQQEDDYQPIIECDPHPHYLDYDLSLRVMAKKR